jgi:hypothetical protein
MKNKSEDNKVHPDKTDWKKVIAQSDEQIAQNAKSDPDSPILTNKKYHKPEKLNK